MPSMSEVVSRHTDLSDDDERWLRLLVSEWQLLADLSFSDLVLWVPDRDPERLLGGGADPADHGTDLAVRRRGG